MGKERFSRSTRLSFNTLLERFSNVERPIPTGASSAMSQSEFLAITCDLLKAREKSRAQDATSFGFTSHRLKNWQEIFEHITMRSNRNRVITFNSHLKTTLKKRPCRNLS